MTMPSRIERNLPLILDELSAAPSPDYLDDVFGRTGRMRQRPAWTFPERWIPMADVARLRAVAPAPPWRLIVLGLLVLALVAVALLAVGAAQRRPAPPFGPASNGEVVYVAEGDVFAADPTSGKTRLLAGGPEIDRGPSYSPDGTSIAFIREAGCCPERIDLYAMRDDGSDLRKVNTASIADLIYANWTPDSRHLAVITSSESGSRLELLDVDGREAPQQLAAGMEIDTLAFRPPDGREIAFRALVDGRYGIFAMNADGTDIRPLQAPTVQESMGMHALDMVYSVDGNQLFYQSYVPTDERAAEGCCQLWVMNADGTDPHPVEPNRAAWSGVPTVSPDGRWVSYWYVFGDEPHFVKVAPVDGSSPAIFTGPSIPDFVPWMWAPDSSKILLASVDGLVEAYLLDPAGGPFKTVPWGGEMDWQRKAP